MKRWVFSWRLNQSWVGTCLRLESEGVGSKLKVQNNTAVDVDSAVYLRKEHPQQNLNDEPFKRFPSQGQGHQNEHDLCLHKHVLQ